MTGLMIVGIIFLLLLLLAFVRVGGRVEFGEDGLFARLRIGAFSFQVFPLEMPCTFSRENRRVDFPLEQV